MNKDRLKKLAGITENKTPVPTKVTLQVPRVKMTDELDFKKLLKEHGLTATIDSNKSVATVVAELDTKSNSENKLLEFVNEWLNKDVPKSDVKLLEGTFTEISDVIRAVDDGQKVFWKTPDYVVGKDLYGDYHITYRPWSKAPNTVALTDHYNAEDFMVSEALAVIQEAVIADEIVNDEVTEQVVEGDNNNFIQPDDVSPDTLNNRMGVDKERKEKVTIPADVKSSIAKRISELKTSIEMYDKKGYNDHSQKEKAIDCLEQILDNLSTNDLEGLKKAQIFFETLMSPITDLFPSKLVNWLAKSVPLLVKEAYYDDDGATEELDPGLEVFLNKFATEELRNDAKAGYELAKEKNDSGHSLEELQNYLKNIEDTGAFGEGFAHYTNHAIQQHVPSDWEHSSGSCEW